MTFKVILRKDVIYKNNTSPLCLLFFHDNRKKSVGLGVSVAREYWNAAEQKVTEDCPDRDNIQFQITATVKEYEKKIKKLEALEIPVTFETLFETIGKRMDCTVGDYFKQIIDSLEKAEKYGSASKHKVTLALMQRFKSTNIRFEKLDSTYLREFELFLRQRGNVSNSIATKFSVLKSVYNKAVSEGVFVSKSDPFQPIKVGSLWTKTHKRAIAKEDIHRLIELDLSDRDFYTQLAKDIFLFSYFMAGINFKDIALLTYENIDHGRIYYSRRKTGKMINCCLTEPAQKIIDKYRTDQVKEDYIFPILNRHIHKTEKQILERVKKTLKQVNKRLHELSIAIGLHTPLTTYAARHTFATVLKRSGVNIALISEFLGHSDLSSDLRDLKTVKKTATAYAKLLFPHVLNVDQLDDETLTKFKEEDTKYCLIPAIEKRQIIREQCHHLDKEYKREMPTFSI
ncbi:phage integrase SAM-like domain-containing protein [uncultured Rikenella sp.]|uniref:phage integrase SAM-like domain-containing protein n=1 Tax=uncultured Rikenella sp. TaxID=368003 RepID=UPI002606298A|nr:phage integrase SAM-like domain-containing protein [uncultured Rikenella sp.]